MSKDVLRDYIAEKRRAGDFEAFVLLHNEVERFPAFVKIHRQLSDADYWRLLAEVWRLSEVIEPNKLTWLRLFQSKRPQRELLMTKSELKALAALPSVFEIWRGYGTQRGCRGMSWTLKKLTAEKFARYSCSGRRAMLTPHFVGAKPRIIRAQCFKADVMAYFSRRGEFEIVIDPKNVMPPLGLSELMKGNAA